jgi:hypothetical protein
MGNHPWVQIPPLPPFNAHQDDVLVFDVNVVKRFSTSPNKKVMKSEGDFLQADGSFFIFAEKSYQLRV